MSLKSPKRRRYSPVPYASKHDYAKPINGQFSWNFNILGIWRSLMSNSRNVGWLGWTSGRQGQFRNVHTGRCRVIRRQMRQWLPRSEYACQQLSQLDLQTHQISTLVTRRRKRRPTLFCFLVAESTQLMITIAGGSCKRRFSTGDIWWSFFGKFSPAVSVLTLLF